MIKITIVTISFNQARFLDQAIKSVLEQDYPLVEYIVVDPGSTDGSREIIEGYRSSIDHIIFDRDEGPADGLNRGFSMAKGQIFGFVNSDDYLLPGALSAAAAAFEASPETDVLSGHAYVVDEAGVQRNRFFSRRFSVRRFVYGASALAQQSTFFRAEIFRKVHGFNVRNRVAWDGELWVDMALAGAKFRRTDRFMSAFRVYDGSITGSRTFQQQREEYQAEIFSRVTGRPRSRRDSVLGAIMKLREYFGHPAILKQRLLCGPTIGH